jgi:hypothetical protein
LRVRRGKETIMRVNLEMQRTALIHIAVEFFAFRIHSWSWNKFPLSTLVMGYVSLDVGIYFFLQKGSLAKS